MDESFQTAAAVAALMLIGYSWLRGTSGGPWIRIRGRNRHRTITARELWYDPRRWSRGSSGHTGHHHGGGSSPADDGDGGGIGGGADCGDGGDGGGD